MHGGGGRTLPAKLGIEDVSSPCHAEQRERAEAQSENHAFRFAVFRELSKTVSASVPRYELVSNVGQTLNQVQGDKNMQCVCKSLPSLRAVGFTMAEILLSLTIIGVVAAITLPSLTGNINERTWNTQRKALYARFSQAIALMPALNGYGTLIEGDSSTSAIDTAAETFVTNGLAKVLKINNICDSEHLADCGFPNKVINFEGEIAFSSFPKTLVEFNGSFNHASSLEEWSYSQIDTKAAAFETANGESIVVFYSPTCTAFNPDGAWYRSQPFMCANFVYDLNGKKGPNSVGKDVGFIAVLYPSDSVVVAPLPLNSRETSTSTTVAWRDAAPLCRNRDSESRLPNYEEAAAMFYNQNLITNNKVTLSFWTNTRESNTNAWSVNILSSGHFNNVRERLAIRHVSEPFEWRIRQRSHARPAVQRGGSGGELLY